MNYLAQMFSGKDGKISSLRVNITLWIVGIMFSIIWIVIKTKAFPAIPDSISLSIPLCLAAKGYQKGKENTTPDAPKTP